MVTARSEEMDRVVGFELGADDYVTKPIDHAKFTKVVLRYCGAEPRTVEANHGDSVAASSATADRNKPGDENGLAELALNLDRIVDGS